MIVHVVAVAVVPEADVEEITAVVIAAEVAEAAPTIIKTSPLRAEANQPLPKQAPILNPKI
jgi:hypothetical protein